MVEKVRNLKPGHGLNAATGEYVDMMAEGIIDPAKVTRSALQNAASIAALFLTTEAVVADKPEKAALPPAAAPPTWAGWTSRSPATRSIRRPRPPQVFGAFVMFVASRWTSRKVARSGGFSPAGADTRSDLGGIG